MAGLEEEQEQKKSKKRERRQATHAFQSMRLRRRRKVEATFGKLWKERYQALKRLKGKSIFEKNSNHASGYARGSLKDLFLGVKSRLGGL